VEEKKSPGRVEGCIISDSPQAIGDRRKGGLRDGRRWLTLLVGEFHFPNQRAFFFYPRPKASLFHSIRGFCAVLLIFAAKIP
jgi:hypothetical protein